MDMGAKQETIQDGATTRAGHSYTPFTHTDTYEQFDMDGNDGIYKLHILDLKVWNFIQLLQYVSIYCIFNKKSFH